MQQKSTQKILLFGVAAQKVEKIKALCKNLGISVQQVEKSDYGQKLGAIPDNVFWSADKLFREIFREHLFMSR